MSEKVSKATALCALRLDRNCTAGEFAEIATQIDEEIEELKDRLAQYGTYLMLACPVADMDVTEPEFEPAQIQLKICMDMWRDSLKEANDE